MPDQADRLQQLLIGRVVPSWFDEFKKQWNNLLTKPLNNIEDRYFIDLERWICSRPSFFQSRFLICKHLIHQASDKVKPESIRLIYQNFKRQTDYPFLIWNSSELQIVSENNEDYTINNPINNIVEPYDTNKSYEHIAATRQRLEPKVAALQRLVDHVNEEFSANNLQHVEAIINNLDRAFTILSDIEKEKNKKLRGTTWRGSKPWTQYLCLLIYNEIKNDTQ